MRVFFCLIVTLSLQTGCQTVSFAKDIKYFSLNSVPKPAEQIGVIKAYNCGFRVFGFGPGSDITTAFRQLRTNYPDLQYVTRLRIERRYRSYAIIDRDCWLLRGIGYQ